MTEKLFLDDAYLQEFTTTITAVKDNAVQLDRTGFYATSGGQPGDSGQLTLNGQTIPVSVAVKGDALDEIWHVLDGGAAIPKVGDTVTGNIDWERRYNLMRMHTCLHLLCSLIVGDVTGGSVSADKGRLDFDLPAGALDKEDLTQRLNARIAEDHPVSFNWISEAELNANPQLIRTMSVRPPTGGGRVRLVKIGTVDLQPCGGTHVKNTAEIGPMAITKIENKGKQNRRISLAFA